MSTRGSVQRVAIVFGVIGLAVGLGVAGYGALQYRALPTFQRSPEPLFFFLDLIRMLVYVPALLMIGIGVVLTGASIQLIVLARHTRRSPTASILAATAPASAPRAARAPATPARVEQAPPVPPPAGPPIALIREFDPSTRSAMIVLAALGVVCSIAIVLYGVRETVWGTGFYFSRRAGFACLIGGGFFLYRAGRYLQAALDNDWDRLPARTQAVTTWLLLGAALLLVAVLILFVVTL